MEKIGVQFLGTGNAIPTERRNHTGILVSFGNENILVDCGENIQRQMRVAKFSPAKLTRILITHWHGDHILGLPGLFQTMAMNNYKRALKIYGPAGTKRNIETIESLINRLNINVQVIELSSTLVDEKDFYIESKPMSHGTPTLAYSIVLKEKRRLNKQKLKKLKLPNSPLIGKLQMGEDILFNGKKITAKAVSFIEEGKKLSIILDTEMNENAFKIAKDSDILISEATFSLQEAEKAKEYQHLTSAQAATIAKKSGAKKLIITHISERYEHNTQIIEKEAKKIFKNTKIAKDFDKFSV